MAYFKRAEFWHRTGSWHNPATAQTIPLPPYDADDYRYPQSVEDRVIAELGGVYGPYTGRWFANKRDGH